MARNERGNGSKRPTLFDVAREAGVGTTTVSRVINGGHYVDLKTMARVKAVMERIHYQPNHAARALKGERTHSIGLILPTLRDAFFAQLASVIQQFVRERDCVLIVLASDDDAAQEVLEIETFQSYRVDGLLVVPSCKKSNAVISSVDALGVPTIAMDRPLSAAYASVTCDNYEASQHAVRHLLAHNRRRILCFGGDAELYTIQERVRGYHATVAAAGFEPLVACAATSSLLEAALHNAFNGAQERPDAIFALHGDAAVAAYEFLSDSPLSIPGDVALLGFDDFPLAASLRPAVSVVRQPVEELARCAAQALFESIAGTVTTPRQIILSTSLVARTSCGCGAAIAQGSAASPANDPSTVR